MGIIWILLFSNLFDLLDDSGLEVVTLNIALDEVYDAYKDFISKYKRNRAL